MNPRPPAYETSALNQLSYLDITKTEILQKKSQNVNGIKAVFEQGFQNRRFERFVGNFGLTWIDYRGF